MSNTERLAIEALRLYLTAYQEHDQAAAIRAADKAARAALAAHDAEQEQAAQAVPADAERLRLAGLALIGLAEHDPHCTVFDLDDEGKHCACSCGYEEAIAVITQAGKMAPAAPAPEAQAVPSEVWEAANKTTSMLFATKAQAEAWLSRFSPSVWGGFEVRRRDVHGTTPAAPQAAQAVPAGHVAWVVSKPGGYKDVGYQSSVLNKLPHGTLLYAKPQPAAGSFMTREQAIAQCIERRPHIEPTEQHIAATIDAYAALFGDLAPAAPAPEARQSDREAILARLEAVPVRSYEAERREVELLLSSPVDWKALWNECRAWNQCRAAMLAAAKGGTQ